MDKKNENVKTTINLSEDFVNKTANISTNYISAFTAIESTGQQLAQSILPILEFPSVYVDLMLGVHNQLIEIIKSYNTFQSNIIKIIEPTSNVYSNSLKNVNTINTGMINFSRNLNLMNFSFRKASSNSKFLIIVVIPLLISFATSLSQHTTIINNTIY